MEFYLIEGENISKYNASFDDAELIKLRNEIIDKCSETTHIDEENFKSNISSFKRIKESFPDKQELRNYQEKDTGRSGGDCDLIVRERIIHVTCDLYVYPHLIAIINGILEGNIESLYELFEPDFTKELKTLEEKITDLDLEINQISNFSKDKISKLELLQSLAAKRDTNKYQVSVKPYYDKVKSLIKKELISSHKLSIIKEALEFINIEELKKHKVLQRIKEKR